MARSRGLPKTGQMRYAKWQAKYDPTVVQTRFNEVAAVAQSRAQAGMLAAAQAQELVSGILDQYGVAGPARAVYISFGLKVFHETQRLTGPALGAAVNGLVQYWQTAYGANPTILNAIAQALGVTALSY
ncbi:MAG: coat protein [Thermoproteus sp.]